MPEGYVLDRNGALALSCSASQLNSRLFEIYRDLPLGASCFVFVAFQISRASCGIHLSSEATFRKFFLCSAFSF